MARTALAYSALVANGSLTTPAGTTIDATLVTNGVKIVAGMPERTILRVTNTHGADHAVTIKAGAYPPAVAAGQGDLAVTVPATSGDVLIGPVESGRFLQSNGEIWVDFATGFTGTVTALRVPRTT
jgi:hypothetical protein